MRGTSIRCFLAAGTAAAMILLAGCEQQPQGEGGLAVTATSAALTQDHVVATGATCTPTGKHAKHAGYACTACHQCAGTLSFDPAVAGPSAAFDATAKTCSNVKCHSVPAGTFTYTTWDYGLDQAVPVTVPYGGQASSSAANWYATGASSCDACHGYPPKYNGVAYPWHSGAHGITVSNGNTCQLCHPDATGAYVYASYLGSSGGMISSCPPGTYCAAPGTITNGSLHGNGVLNVQAPFVSACFGCH